MERVRVGLIGCGGIARWHLGLLAGIPEAKVVALCDPDPKQIGLCREQFPALGEVPAFEDHGAMIAAGGLDAVEISTPHTQHLEQMQSAFAAGLHVLCEKPLATNTADARAAIAARDRAGRVGVLGYQRHFQPEFRLIRERVLSGVAGPVQFVSALQCQEWKRLTVGTWRQDPALSGGGQLNDSGSHLLDVLLWATGLEAESVCAFDDSRQTPVDINSTLSVRFKGGALGSVTVVGDAHAWHEDFTVWCGRESYFLREGALTIVSEDGSRREVPPSNTTGNPDANFVDAILGRAEVESPFECGLAVIGLTEAAWRSAAQGGVPVSVA
ncbi:MAG: Gfo/Idh/MocA family oxidoreductase [Fimbriimonadaceae bacterium]|nr:Gfo/Idh/MocA family oxidoreductase [Fimbriimonadaceae bacterium]